MKKNIIVIMTVLIILCLSACGSNNSNNQTIIFEQRVNDQYLSIIGRTENMFHIVQLIQKTEVHV